jgi:hypothetical protein
MALRRDTEWNRCTVQKAMASCVVGPDDGAPPDSHRVVRLVLRAGTIAVRIIEAGFDPNDEIAASRSWEWPEEEGPSSTLHFRLRPNQTVWAIVANESSQGGIVKLSAIVEFHEEHAP